MYGTSLQSANAVASPSYLSVLFVPTAPEPLPAHATPARLLLLPLWVNLTPDGALSGGDPVLCHVIECQRYFMNP